MTVLSNFAHIRRPDLVREALGANAATVATVLLELQAGEALGLVPHCDWRWLPVVLLSDEETKLAAKYNTQLDAAESACLAVAKERTWTLLTDDFAARWLAVHEGVAISGTLGLLQSLLAAAHTTLEEADGYLTVMRSHGYRAPVSSICVLFDS